MSAEGAEGFSGERIAFGLELLQSGAFVLIDLHEPDNPEKGSSR